MVTVTTAAGSTTLAVSDSTHGHTADAATLGVSLIAADSTHTHNADPPSLRLMDPAPPQSIISMGIPPLPTQITLEVLNPTLLIRVSQHPLLQPLTALLPATT